MQALMCKFAKVIVVLHSKIRSELTLENVFQSSSCQYASPFACATTTFYAPSGCSPFTWHKWYVVRDLYTSFVTHYLAPNATTFYATSGCSPFTWQNWFLSLFLEIRVQSITTILLKNQHSMYYYTIHYIIQRLTTQYNVLLHEELVLSPACHHHLPCTVRMAARHLHDRNDWVFYLFVYIDVVLCDHKYRRDWYD